tara:strand:- start:1021 stop:1245 length:225 start_codon:yes stop_codon:yes gene_type:complete
MDDKFKDAIPTSTLVVKPNTVPADSKKATKEGLQAMTKTKIVEYAQQELGIELDLRLSKQAMINQVVNENIVNE